MHGRNCNEPEQTATSRHNLERPRPRKTPYKWNKGKTSPLWVVSDTDRHLILLDSMQLFFIKIIVELMHNKMKKTSASKDLKSVRKIGIQKCKLKFSFTILVSLR